MNNKAALGIGCLALAGCACACVSIFFIIGALDNNTDFQDIIDEAKTATEQEINDSNSNANLEYVTCSNMNSKFLMPEGWYKIEETSTMADTCFISKEKVAAYSQDQFKTGLTVIKYKDSQETFHRSSLDSARALVEALSQEERYKVEPMQEVSAPPFKGYYRMATTQNYSSPFRAYIGAFGSDKSNAVYSIIFEAPNEEWDTEWRNHGKPMIEHIGLSL